MAAQTPAALLITTNQPVDFKAIQRISRRRKPPPLIIMAHDARWAARYETLHARIHRALGPRALSIAHVGSTSVPGLPAKPIVDVDVVVADPTDEAAYVSALSGDGWEERAGLGSGGAGLRFLFREPGWHEHRFFVLEPESGADADGEGGGFWANVHVFGPGCPEVERHRIFKEWLLEHPEDRDRYAAAKREAAQVSRDAGESTTECTRRKEPVVLDILDQAFKARGLLS
ncbi:unnamed protein product [Discula destructiva]